MLQDQQWLAVITLVVKWQVPFGIYINTYFLDGF